MLGRTRCGNLAHSWRIAAARAIAPPNTRLVPPDLPERPSTIVAPSPTSKRVQHVLHTDISRSGPRTTFAAVLNPTPDGGSQVSFAFTLDHESQLLRIGSTYLNVPPQYTALTESWVQWFALWFWRDLLKGGEVQCRSDQPLTPAIVGGLWPPAAKRKSSMPLEVASAIGTAVADLSKTHDMQLRYSYIPSGENKVAHRLSQCHTSAIREAKLSQEMREQVEASEKRIKEMGSNLIRDEIDLTAISQLSKQPMTFAILALTRFLPSHNLRRVFVSTQGLWAKLSSWRAAGPHVPSPRNPVVPKKEREPSSSSLPGADESSPVAKDRAENPGTGRTSAKRRKSVVSTKQLPVPVVAAGATPTPLPAQTSLPSETERRFLHNIHLLSTLVNPDLLASDSATTSSPSSLSSPPTTADRPNYEIRTHAFRQGPYITYAGALYPASEKGATSVFNLTIDHGQSAPELGSLSLTAFSVLFGMAFFGPDIAGGRVTFASIDPRVAGIITGELTDFGVINAAIGKAFGKLARRHHIDCQYEVRDTYAIGLARTLTRFHSLPGRRLADLTRQVKVWAQVSDKRIVQMKLEGYVPRSESIPPVSTNARSPAAKAGAGVHVSSLGAGRKKRNVASTRAPAAAPAASPNSAIPPSCSSNDSTPPCQFTAPPSLITKPAVEDQTVTLRGPGPLPSSTNPQPNPRPKSQPSTPPITYTQPRLVLSSQDYVLRAHCSVQASHITFSGALYAAGQTEPEATYSFTFDRQSAQLQIGSMPRPVDRDDFLSTSSYGILLALDFFKVQLQGRQVICYNNSMGSASLSRPEHWAGRQDSQKMAAFIAHAIGDIGRDNNISIEHDYASRIDNKLAIELCRFTVGHKRAWLTPTIKAQLLASEERLVKMGLPGYIRRFANVTSASSGSDMITPIMLAEAASESSPDLDSTSS